MKLYRSGTRGRFLRKVLGTGIALLALTGNAFASDNSQLVDVSVGEALKIPAWSHLTTLIDRDEATIEACRQDGSCDRSSVAAFVAFLGSVDDLPRDQQLEAVNNHFNRLPYMNDDTIFGIEDVWQSPLSFAAGSGDCEDYAIAKYAALRLLGFAEQDMRLIVLLDESRGIHHAVLEVQQDGHAKVLDNLSTEVEFDMDEDYRPIYALNQVDHWIYMPAAEPEPDPVQTAPASGDDATDEIGDFLISLF